MAQQLTLRTTDNGDIYVYMEDSGGDSMAVGSNVSDGVFALNVSTSPNTSPDETTGSIVIYPGANGDLLFRPHGSGKSEFNTGSVQITLGNIALHNTQSNGLVGLIEYAGKKFLHNFGDRSAWIGEDAGNLSLTTAADNNGHGYQAFSSITSGQQNNALGNQAGLSLTSGSNNNIVGYQAAKNLVSGQNNVIMGEQSGFAYTTNESSNILLNNLGVIAESNTLRFGSATGTGVGELNRAFICGIDGRNVGSVATVVTEASNQLGTATITGGTGVTVTPTANTITINTTGGGISWTEVTGTSSGMAVNNGYIANNAGVVTLTLPSTAALGSVVKVAGKGAGGWSIAQNSGQTINWDATTATTTGVTGAISSIDRYATIEILCITADTTFVVLNAKGNMNVV